MKTFNGLDAFEQAVGTHLSYSHWHTITQEQINLFAEATDDHQWIHTDPERAATGPFGTTIAHGYLTLSLVPTLVWQIYTVEGLRMGASYGCNKVRLPSPVPVGSRIRAGVELLDLKRNPRGAQATVQVTIEQEGGDKPACVAETVSVLVN
jgi:acyl dehydratase